MQLSAWLILIVKLAEEPEENTQSQQKADASHSVEGKHRGSQAGAGRVPGHPAATVACRSCITPHV